MASLVEALKVANLSIPPPGQKMLGDTLQSTYFHSSQQSRKVLKSTYPSKKSVVYLLTNIFVKRGPPGE